MIPATYRPIYHTAGAQPAAPFAVREPRPSGASGLGADSEGSSTFTKMLWYAAAVGVVYVFRKPIGNWLAGLDPEGQLPGRAARAAGRGVRAGARGAKRLYSSYRDGRSQD